jgi:hypothetical protein
LGRAGPVETLGSPWIPLPIRACGIHHRTNQFFHDYCHEWQHETINHSFRSGRMARGGHGLPQVSPGSAMPNASTPCGRAIPETALRPSQGSPLHKVGGLRRSSTLLDTPRRTSTRLDLVSISSPLFSVANPCHNRAWPLPPLPPLAYLYCFLPPLANMAETTSPPVHTYRDRLDPLMEGFIAA